MQHVPTWAIRLFPFLLAVSFPLGMWLDNLVEAPPAVDVALSFVIALAFALVAGLASGLFTRHLHRRTLLVALAVVGCFAYGHVFQVLSTAGMLQRYFAPAWFALVVTAGVAVIRCPWETAMRRVATIAVLASPILLVVQVVSTSPVWWAQLVDTDGPPPLDTRLVQSSQGLPARRPDIYYLIFDAYARGDVLEEKYGFDNREFLDALRRRGFYVAQQAQANYAQTRLSLPSSLSMSYLPEFPEADQYPKHHRTIRRLRNDNAVVRRLRQLGYRYRYVGSPHDPSDPMADEDLYLGSSDGSYLTAFLSTTALGVASHVVARLEMFRGPIQIHEFQFHHVAKPKVQSAPLFTFAHVLCPHGPYVYDRHGPLPQPVAKEAIRPEHYVEQLRYLNRRILELIDAIDRTSGPDAVILLQADHGPDFLGMSRQPTRRQVAERMSILSAYRVPREVKQLLYPSVTPVNSFRVVFDGLFGDRLRLLPDRALYSTYGRPFRFVEITSNRASGRESASAATAP